MKLYLKAVFLRDLK